LVSPVVYDAMGAGRKTNRLPAAGG
jgi:hypothetical protein